MNTFYGRIPSSVTRSCLVSSGLTSVKVVTMGGKCEDNCLWFPLLRRVRLQLGTSPVCYFISSRSTLKLIVLTGEWRDLIFWGEFNTRDRSTSPLWLLQTELTLCDVKTSEKAILGLGIIFNSHWALWYLTNTFFHWWNVFTNPFFLWQNECSDHSKHTEACVKQVLSLLNCSQTPQCYPDNIKHVWYVTI